METLLYIAAAGLAAGTTAVLARSVWRNRDAERRRVERDGYRERREAERRERAQAAVGQLVDRFFPFAKAAWDAGADRGEARQRLRQVLAETAGLVLGTADVGFNAILPDATRRQHLVCLGKSGYGKTTIALRMIREDLRRGRGICILGSEAELFRDWLLPLVPPSRAKDVIFFRPADAACTLTWNPLALEEGDDRALAGGELFAIFKRAIGETSIGSRADAILSAAFGILVGTPGATLTSVIRLMEDEAYRAAVIAGADDDYLAGFWARTFPDYPAGATLPLSNRLNQFLRLPQLRAALCHPISSFSIRKALAESRILFLDLSGLDPDAIRLVGQMMLSKFQIELMRRERIPEEQRTPIFAYIDEFHAFVDSASATGTWRELLARGRRYNLALHVLTQHSQQLPTSLQREIFGNVSNIIALNLSANDAAAVRRELLVPGPGDTPKPIPVEDFVSLSVGQGFARLGTGACALRVNFAAPIERPDAAIGERVRETSWRTYAAPPVPEEERLVPAPTAAAKPAKAGGSKEATPGRGGSQHKMLQRLAKEWGEERGFRGRLEESILGGAGRVDVVLERDDLQLAVEICLTNTAAEITDAAAKCIASGFAYVAIVTTEDATRAQIERTVLDAVPGKDRDRLRVVSPDGLRLLVEELSDSRGAEGRTVGYRVRVQPPAADRMPHRRAVARLIGSALLERRSS